jgi:twitching motility protein PilT
MIDLPAMLDLVVRESASDLHISVGRPPVLKRSGRLRNLNVPSLVAADTEAIVRSISPERALQELLSRGSADFAYAHTGGARFRVSVYRQRGFLQATLRLIPSRIRTFEELGLPESIRPTLSKTRGLVLVTGPTGSGKTTTLAAMVDYINTNFDRHIITIEDPIEYYHEHKKSVVTQREVGTDVESFEEGLRRALRQAPDVILLGEMRDLETISAAITAAETGHLVFGTLHTTGSTRTVDRMIDAFPANQQEQIRAQLAVSIVGVISQVLIPRADKDGVTAAYEIMFMTSAIENHIRKNESFKITSAIQTSKKLGMTLLDDMLFDLLKEGKISFESAMAKSQHPRDFEDKLKGAGLYPNSAGGA